MRLRFLQVLLLACLFWGPLATPFAQMQNSPPSAPAEPAPGDAGTSPPTTQAQTSPQNPSPTSSNDTKEIQEEVGNRDVTYLRTRFVYSYDYKDLTGEAETNRFRLKFFYAFGPDQRLAVSILVPIIYKDQPSASATGIGDTELQTGGVLYESNVFRTGVAFKATFQTSTENLLGGSTTTIQPAWGFVVTPSSRVELTSAFYYKQSIHTVRGKPTKQFEPDITFNLRARRVTWFVEYDSYYDFIPAQYAQTMKIGFACALNKSHKWVAAPYYSAALNSYGSHSQYKYNTGVDLTWYVLKNR